MEIICKDRVFTLKNGSDVLLHTDANTPMVYVGYGEERVEMYRGNFKLEDHLLERRPLTLTSARVTEQGTELDLEGQLKLLVTEKEGAVTLTVAEKAEGINRFWLHVEAAEDEHVYGCGEQMSYFDLRGRHFPLWSSEPGVGRDKTTYVTWRSDVENGGAGGDYYNTNYPQPTYVSSRHYYLHMDTTAYGDFDFRNPRYHELQCWNVPGFIRIEAAPTFVELLEKLTAFLGRQPELPEWIYNGLIIGAQGGNERSFGIVDKSLEHGIKVSGLWCQDWCGKRVTSFGTPTCPNTLKSSTPGASSSWVTSTPTSSTMASSTPRAKSGASSPKRRMAPITWWTLASSTAAWWISPTPRPTTGSRMRLSKSTRWTLASTAGWQTLASISPPTIWCWQMASAR